MFQYTLVIFHVSWTIAASCAFGSRLLLNIRERYFKEQSFVGVDTIPVFRGRTENSTKVENPNDAQRISNDKGCLV